MLDEILMISLIMGISPAALLRWQPERSEVSLSLFVSWQNCQQIKSLLIYSIVNEQIRRDYFKLFFMLHIFEYIHYPLLNLLPVCTLPAPRKSINYFF